MASAIMSAEEIMSAIRKGEIRFAYYAIRKEDGTIVEPEPFTWVSPDVSEGVESINFQIAKFFEEHLKLDSITLTLGPLAQLERSPLFRRKGLGKRGDKYTWNIKDTKCLPLGAKDFVLVGTNEYIELSEDIGASLHTPVRNTDVGLSHISTIIDPGWQGILQIGVTNTSRKAKSLGYLKPVCTLRFHRIEKKINADIVEHCRRDWPHYQNNWWKIFKEPGKSLFPPRFEHVDSKPLWLVSLCLWLVSLWEKAKPVLGVFGVLALVLCLVFIFKTEYDVRQATRNKDYIDLLSIRTKTLEDSQKRGTVLCASAQRVLFKDGERIQTVNVVFPFPTKLEPLVIPAVEGPESLQLVYSVSSRPNSESGPNRYTGTVISVRYRGEFPKGQPVECLIKWLVICFEADQASD